MCSKGHGAEPWTRIEPTTLTEQGQPYAEEEGAASDRAKGRNLHSKPPNVVTRWGTNPNVGNLDWGSESEFLTELLR